MTEPCRKIFIVPNSYENKLKFYMETCTIPTIFFSKDLLF